MQYVRHKNPAAGFNDFCTASFIAFTILPLTCHQMAESSGSDPDFSDPDASSDTNSHPGSEEVDKAGPQLQQVFVDRRRLTLPSFLPLPPVPDAIRAIFMDRIVLRWFSKPMPIPDIVTAVRREVPPFSRLTWNECQRDFITQNLTTRVWPSGSVTFHVTEPSQWAAELLRRRRAEGRCVPDAGLPAQLYTVHYFDGMGRPLGRWRALGHVASFPSLFKHSHAHDAWFPFLLHLDDFL